MAYKYKLTYYIWCMYTYVLFECMYSTKEIGGKIQFIFLGIAEAFTETVRILDLFTYKKWKNTRFLAR